jgi:hypothetical protein
VKCGVFFAVRTQFLNGLPVGRASPLNRRSRFIPLLTLTLTLHFLHLPVHAAADGFTARLTEPNWGERLSVTQGDPTSVATSSAQLPLTVGAHFTDSYCQLVLMGQSLRQQKVTERNSTQKVLDKFRATEPLGSATAFKRALHVTPSSGPSSHKRPLAYQPNFLIYPACYTPHPPPPA